MKTNSCPWSFFVCLCQSIIKCLLTLQLELVSDSQSHWLIWYWLNIKLVIKGYKDLHCKRLRETALIRQTDVSGCDNDSSKFSPCIKQVVDGFGK